MIAEMSEEMLWRQIVAKAWCDDAFMKRLFSDPRSVLAEHSLAVPEDTEVQVTEGTEVKVMVSADTVRHYVLPVRPPDELTDEDLGGGVVAWCACACASAACRGCVASAVCGRCGRCGCRCF
jgi:hypothetical protein